MSRNILLNTEPGTALGTGDAAVIKDKLKALRLEQDVRH